MANSEANYRAEEQRLWASVDLTPTEQFLSLARTGATVRCLTVGSGDPIVFVHGGSNAGSSWVDLASRLVNRQCVLLDRPGCGLSPRLPTPLTDAAALARFADDFLADVFDALGLPTADVIGTSFGGYFSLRGVASMPERVPHLVLLGYSIGIEMQYVPPMMRMSVIPGLGQLMTRMSPPKAAIKPMLRQIGLKGALASGRFDQGRVNWFRSLLVNTDTMLNELRDLPKLMTPIRGVSPALRHSDENLARITSPTLLLWGRDDPMGDESVATAFASRFPSAVLEMVDGGHAVWMDDPDAIAARVADFLA